MKKESMLHGEEYYTLVGQKNVEGVKNYLHPEVEFYGPLASLKGRDAVVKATSHFMSQFKSLTIRAKFGNTDQALLVYDLDIPGISSSFPGASMLTFQDDLIVRIDLFYDGSRFLQKREEIFS